MKNTIISAHRFILGLKWPSKKKNIQLLAKRGEFPSDFKFREASAQDVPALAALHVKAWSQTYWMTLFPPTYAIRYSQWQHLFNKKNESWFCFVVENKNGELVGFAMGKTYDHQDLPEFSGELNKIYLLREYQRLGLGRKLVGVVARKFLSMGIHNMVLFGTAENPSNKFHDALCGEKLIAGNGEFHGGYCWRDLEKLAEACPID